uniref:SXP/RAL-2 family protein Ani s 5-like cation-binding domain-containing protein n=1 Tax=Panagrolaimus davidi TaxID=227884 RepID=A0A914NZ17_9BILA
MSEKHDIMRGMFEEALGSTMNEKQRKKLDEILNNPKLSKDEVNESIKALCVICGKETMKKYQEISEMFQERMAKLSAKMKEEQEKFTEETKAFLHKLHKIHEDPSLSYQNEHDKFKEAFEHASPIVKTDLRLFGEPFTHLIHGPVER